MRRVEQKPLREYFSSGLKHEEEFRSGPFLLVRRHLFNPFALLVITCVILLVASFFGRPPRILLSAILLYTGFLYYSLRACAEGVFLRRKCKSLHLTERQEAEIVIEIMNASRFSLQSGFAVQDDFGASLDHEVDMLEYKILPPQSRLFLKYKRTCDAGMGAHTVGPLKIKISDSLGIFEFRVIEDKLEHIEVYPHVTAIPPLPVRGSDNSNDYGSYEVATRGLSVNFSGVRPFHQGDSLRHIAWKLSAKNQDLMVKEFEKVVNCDVSVILNLDPLIHVGFKSDSTWEHARDCALSVMSQQIDLGNTVQFFTNSFFTPGARGDDHFKYLCRKIMNLDPQTVPAPEILSGRRETGPPNLVKKFKEWIPSGSTVFYISVFDRIEFANVFPELAALRARHIQVFCIYVDASSLFGALSVDPLYAAAFLAKGSSDLTEAMTILKLAGIYPYVIDHHHPLHKALLPEAEKRRA